LLIAISSEILLAEFVWILGVERYSTGGGRFECAENIQQRALAAARWPHDRNGVAALQL
jgi:hypothetical protein